MSTACLHCAPGAFIRRDKARQDVLYNTKNLGTRSVCTPDLSHNPGYRAAIQLFSRFSATMFNVVIWKEGVIRLAHSLGLSGTLIFSEYGKPRRLVIDSTMNAAPLMLSGCYRNWAAMRRRWVMH